jgi:osmoprotectant transport system ATP-binding protein
VPPIASSGDAAIHLRDVRKSFGGSAAVDGVSLEIGRGEFVALVGRSGSGKTTALKIVHRLVEPDSGVLRVLGRHASEEPAHLWRRRIGYVLQEVGLFPHMSVAENIGVTPGLLGWPKDEIAARTAELLSLVGLDPGYAAREPDQLSGGQRQRVGVARALAARPAILLMDEPFGALDPETREDLGRHCRELHDALGLTTVMVTHDMQEALLLADRIVVMGSGRILADSTPAVLMAGHADPEVAALMASPRRQAERLRVLLEAGGRG